MIRIQARLQLPENAKAEWNPSVQKLRVTTVNTHLSKSTSILNNQPSKLKPHNMEQEHSPQILYYLIRIV
jgi:hypothetical protein